MWLPVYRYTLHPPLFYMDQKRTRHRRRRAQVLLYHSPSRGASNVSLAMFYVSRGVSRPVSEDSRASRFEAFCFLARLLACEISDRLESDFVADDSASPSLTFGIRRIDTRRACRCKIKFQPQYSSAVVLEYNSTLSISSSPAAKAASKLKRRLTKCRELRNGRCSPNKL